MAYIISVMFGMLQLSVLDSIVAMVDTVTGSEEIDTTFRSGHAKQRKRLCGFQRKSPLAGFSICAGYINGSVIWTHKPTKADCEDSGVDETTFFCGRKDKFGLNIQAVCTHKKRFMSISILYGASDLDHLAFEISELTQYELSVEEFLAQGLCIVGDNACSNTFCMVTPYLSQHLRVGWQDRGQGQAAEGCLHFLSFSAADYNQWYVLVYHSGLGHVVEANAKRIHAQNDFGSRFLFVRPLQFSD